MKKRLSGLPNYVVEEAKKNAKLLNLKGAVLTLLAPCVYPVLQYSKDRALRYSIYSRNARKASELSEEGAHFDNSNIMAEILKTRYKKANLLGQKWQTILNNLGFSSSGGGWKNEPDVSRHS